jgi:hypothetical protein
MMLAKSLTAYPWGWKYFLYGIILGAIKTASRLYLLSFWGLCGYFFFSPLVERSFSLLGVGGGMSHIVGLCIGIPVGFVVSSIITWALGLSRILLFRPFPVCSQGRCRSIQDYTWNPADIFGRIRWGVYAYECRCGDRYIRLGKKFLKVIGDEHRPFKKLSGFREWMDDD